MNCMLKEKSWLLCHLARVVPAAGVFASVLILSLRLQGDDGWLHLMSVLESPPAPEAQT